MPQPLSQASKPSLILVLIALGLFWPGAVCAQQSTAEVSIESVTETPKVEEARLEEPSVDDEAIGQNTPPVDASQAQGDDLAVDESTLQDPMAMPDPLQSAETTEQGLPRNIPPDYLPLQLDVSINGVPTDFISAFYMSPDGRIASTRSELLELTIVAPGQGPDDELIHLDQIPSATFTYNEEQQTIDLKITPTSRTEQILAMRAKRLPSDADQAAGILLNYSVFSAFNTDYGFKKTSVTGLSSHLDARVFTRFGSLDVSGIIATPDFEVAETTRLDTTYYFEDAKRMMEYRLGDVISGGMNWSRPVRLGGGQIRRNFAMRPDLVTMPLPEISGTAGVPSNLDVYIGGIRAFSGELREGPFRLDSVPIITGEGTARVVLTDALGREVASEGEFATSPDLLRPGLFEFSAEAGYLRRGYGSDSFNYADYPAIIGSGRLGLTNQLTAEAHVEASEDLINGGVGFVTAIPHFGVLSAAGAASLHDDGTGFLLHAAWEKHLGDFFVRIASSRTIGDYQDLAAIDSYLVSGTHEGDVPSAVDQIGLGYAWPEQDMSVNLNFLHVQTADNKRDLILGGSVNKAFGDIQISGGGFYNFSEDDDFGLTLGMSMPLGPSMTASSSVARTSQGYELDANLTKAHSDDAFSTSWGVSYDRISRSRGSARGELRTPVGTANADVSVSASGFGGSLGYNGSAVITRNGVLLGRSIGESFAIVDTGVPGVKVRHENRFAGVTNRNGLLLVPSVVPYSDNKFEIDLDSMPLTAEAPDVEKHIVPHGRSGILVDFKVTGQTTAAILQLKDTSGEFIPLSSEVILDGNPEPFVMGYDGEVYLTNLSARNTVTVKLARGSCKVEFDFTGGDQEAAYLGPLTCA